MHETPWENLQFCHKRKKHSAQVGLCENTSKTCEQNRKPSELRFELEDPRGLHSKKSPIYALPRLNTNAREIKLGHTKPSNYTKTIKAKETW